MSSITWYDLIEKAREEEVRFWHLGRKYGLLLHYGSGGQKDLFYIRRYFTMGSWEYFCNVDSWNEKYLTVYTALFDNQVESTIGIKNIVLVEQPVVAE